MVVPLNNRWICKVFVLLFSCWGLYWSGIAHAQVNATINTSSVSENQSVTLTVRDASDQSIQPDFSVLTDAFELSGTSSQSSVSITNGRIESSRSWSVVLMPKQVGIIDIPPIPVGRYQTQPLRLMVQPLSAVERSQINLAAFMETVVSHEKQYPQAAIYVTRRLFYSDAVRRIPSLPQEKELNVTGASVFNIGSRETTRQIRNNVNYVVMQWRYVVFAEKSGEIRIPGDSIRVGIQQGLSGSRMHNVVAEEKVISVLPIPTEFPSDQPWFPASHVELTQTFEPANLTQMTLGGAMTRTIELKAENSYESAMVPLELPSDAGLRIYPDQVSKESLVQGNEVWGRISRTFNILPIEHGSQTIPDFSVVWWDIVNEQVRTETVKGRPITVLNPGEPNVAPDEIHSDGVVASDSDTEDSIQSASVLHSKWGYFLIASSVVGWLLALVLLWWLMTGRQLRSPDAQPTRKRADNRELIQAIEAKNPVLVKQMVIQILATNLGLSKHEARRVLLHHDKGRALIDKLDAHAYGSESDNLNLNYKEIKYLIDNIVEVYLSKNRNSDLSLIFAH